MGGAEIGPEIPAKGHQDVTAVPVGEVGDRAGLDRARCHWLLNHDVDATFEGV
jgi:hypothetical protein